MGKFKSKINVELRHAFSKAIKAVKNHNTEMKNRSLKRKAHRNEAVVTPSGGDAGTESKLAKVTDTGSSRKQDNSSENVVADAPNKTNTALKTHSDPDVQQEKVTEKPEAEVVSKLVLNTDETADNANKQNQTGAESNKVKNTDKTDHTDCPSQTDDATDESHYPADEKDDTAEQHDASQSKKSSTIADDGIISSEGPPAVENEEKQDVTEELYKETISVTEAGDKPLDTPGAAPEHIIAANTDVTVENEVDKGTVKQEETEACNSKVYSEEVKVEQSKISLEETGVDHDKTGVEHDKLDLSKINSVTAAVNVRGSKDSQQGQHDEEEILVHRETAVDSNNGVTTILENSNNNAADVDRPALSCKTVLKLGAGDGTMATDEVTATDNVTPADDDITADDDVTDDMTDSQFCEVDWPSQFLSQAHVCLEAQTEHRLETTSPEALTPFTQSATTQVQANQATENLQLENATAVVVTLIKELQHINRSMLKTKREIETARRQRHH